MHPQGVGAPKPHVTKAALAMAKKSTPSVKSFFTPTPKPKAIGASRANQADKQAAKRASQGSPQPMGTGKKPKHPPKHNQGKGSGKSVSQATKSRAEAIKALSIQGFSAKDIDSLFPSN